MPDDRPRNDPGDPDDLEPVSGDPLDTLFEVEHVGEDHGDAVDETGGDPEGVGDVDDPGDAQYTVDPQLGESPPPELTGGDTDDGDQPWPWGAPSDPPTPAPVAADDAPVVNADDPTGDPPEPDAPVIDAPPHHLGLDAVDVTGAPDRPTAHPDPYGDPLTESAWDPPATTDPMFGADEIDPPSTSDIAPDPVADVDADLEPWDDGFEPFPGAAGEDDHDDEQPFHPALPADALPGAPEPAAEPGADGFDPWSAPTAAPDDLVPGDGDEPEYGDEPADWATFTDEHYIRSSTSDYKGLADELAARAEAEPDVAQSAVAAGIPGIDSGVVGLEDVGDDPAPAIVYERGPSATDLGLRVLTGVGLLALFAAALVSRTGLTIVATVLFGLAAGEFYAVLVRVGQHPLSLFGLLGAVGGLIGTALWGLGAIPVALVATLVAVALYYALSASRPDPLTDGGLTVMVVAWALLGAFVYPIIDAPDYRWWVLAVVALVVAMDIGQYFVGRTMGSRPLAPVVSPKKTVEGLIGGAVVAVVVAFALSFLGPLTLPSMLVLAAATIVLGPLGDLSVSLLKRIIGVKDMGTILPGHGGILDRVDSLIFVLPAAWVIFETMGLLT